MSKIDDLINQLCPDGVEYKKLGEVCEARSGWGFRCNTKAIQQEITHFIKSAT